MGNCWTGAILNLWQIDVCQNSGYKHCMGSGTQHSTVSVLSPQGLSALERHGLASLTSKPHKKIG